MITSKTMRTYEDLEALPVNSVLVTSKGSTHVLWKISEGMWSDGVIHQLLTYALHHHYGELVAVWVPEQN